MREDQGVGIGVAGKGRVLAIMLRAPPLAPRLEIDARIDDVIHQVADQLHQ